MKKTKALILALALVLVSTAAWAQQRFELVPYVGYRTTGNLEVTGLDYSNLKLKAGFAYGLTFGYRLSPGVLVELMWSRVTSSVEAKPLEVGQTTTLGDVVEDMYHLNFLFYFMNPEAKARPFFLLGLGMTSANPKPAEINGEIRDGSAETRFSAGLGLGLEAMFSNSVGLRVLAKWAPTYINSQEEIWVDWWGYPWVVTVANYMHQWEFTGGLVFRF